MIKREAKFTVLFRHWLMANPGNECAAFELKQTAKNSIPFSNIKEHQIEALRAAKHGEKGMLYKAPDDSRAIKPFDLFYLKNSYAFIVIKFPDFFCLIDIDKFLFSRERNERKSLTAEEAKTIAYKVVPLKGKA